MAAKSTPELSPRDREQLELIWGLYRNTPVGVGGALFGVLVLCWVFLHIAPERLPLMLTWLALTVASGAGQLVLWALWRRAMRRGDVRWRPWARRFVVASLVEGLRWGWGVAFLAAPGAAEQQLWVSMVVACAASSSVSSLGSYIPAFYALLIPATTPIALVILLHPDPRYQALGLLGLVLAVTIGWLGWRQSRFLEGALRLRFENLDLAEDLRRQKELAEEANRAKSQFLAAASHDLRQPMHALGLFVAALGQERMSAGGRRLALQIHEAVDAMAQLFDGLLDLSQLDAGVVRPTLRAFPLDPLLDRVCREQAAEVRGRPVALRRVRTTAVVRSDPLLLERMVRNVIGNAVRHTRRGRILVGVRRARTHLTISVSDTGPGIAEADRRRIFDDYVQLGNPQRDRAHGLGLGLAITRRLADLLGCEVSVGSEPGRGSTFRIGVPRAEASDVVLALDGDPAPPVAAGLVFVVDDEPAVRDGAVALLTRWGFRTLAAGSGHALLAAADPADPPMAILCDWRLANDEPALEVIAAVRQAYGVQVPAALVTGDTAAGELKGLAAAGFMVLHKPVAPSRLRAVLAALASPDIAARGPMEASATT